MILRVGDSRRSSDVLFVSHAKNQDLGALETLLVIVQGRGNGIHDVVGHGGVDFRRPVR